MKDEEAKATILQLLQEIAPDIDPEELGMDENIREVFGIDSFDFLQLIIGIDKELNSSFHSFSIFFNPSYPRYIFNLIFLIYYIIY